MLINEYQKQATAYIDNDVQRNLKHDVWLLGLLGESGEIADLVKKRIGHGHSFNSEKMKLELGDLLWYLTIFGASLDINLVDMFPKGIEDFNDYAITVSEFSYSECIFSITKYIYCLIELYIEDQISELPQHTNEPLETFKNLVYYMGCMVKKFPFNMDDVAVANLHKIHKRYPDGFSTQASLNRTC